MFGKLITLVILSTAISAYSDCHSYEPVCGSNYQTYQNACQCQKANVVVKYKGSCHDNRYKKLSEYKWNNSLTGDHVWDWNNWNWKSLDSDNLDGWWKKYGHLRYTPNRNWSKYWTIGTPAYHGSYGYAAPSYHHNYSYGVPAYNRYQIPQTYQTRGVAGVNVSDLIDGGLAATGPNTLIVNKGPSTTHVYNNEGKNWSFSQNSLEDVNAKVSTNDWDNLDWNWGTKKNDGSSWKWNTSAPSTYSSWNYSAPTTYSSWNYSAPTTYSSWNYAAPSSVSYKTTSLGTVDNSSGNWWTGASSNLNNGWTNFVGSSLYN